MAMFAFVVVISKMSTMTQSVIKGVCYYQYFVYHICTLESFHVKRPSGRAGTISDFLHSLINYVVDNMRSR